MIQELYIENFAIIQKTRAEFVDGLNVLTGETGAGKSIIVEALELIMGSRADKDFVGNYSDRALIEASFKVNEDCLAFAREEYGLFLDNEIIVTREIFKEGNSVARINSRRVNLQVIKDIMERLVNIHGQSENQILYDTRNYLEILDSFAREESGELLDLLGDLFDKRSAIEREIKDYDLDEGEIEREIDILDYQIKEITDSNIENLDLDELQQEYMRLNNAETIAKVFNRIVYTYSSDSYSEGDISSKLDECLTELDSIASYDQEIQELHKEYTDIVYRLESLYEEIYLYQQNIDFDEARIAEINDIFSNMENLKRKYGPSKDDILNYRDEAEKRIDLLNSREERLNNLKDDLANIDEKISITAKQLSELRERISKKVEKKVLAELTDLNFPNAKFKIRIKEKNEVDRSGGDTVDFLVSFNLGQALKSLSKVGSGGEISRFMLALKIVMADHDKIDSLIFDEIDSGISGITAAKVGKALEKLSTDYQIILVTHLSQIAIKADRHILIEKYIDQGLTKSRLKLIYGEDRVLEIARLIGGDQITKTTIENAREQIEGQSG